MGKILAYSGLMEGKKEVSWMRYLDLRQRGGTANVTTVILSDERIQLTRIE